MNFLENHKLRSYLLIACLFFSGNAAFGQAADNEVTKQIDRLFSKYNSATPGVAIAVVKDGKVIFRKGYGSANLEYNVPVSTKTVFNVASVSKQFTAFAIYLLEKQGKLSLEDDVRKHIPELPDFGKTVKIKHLLAHTSGIKDQWSLLTLAGWRMDDVITDSQILRLITRQKELNFEPGSQYLYSNSGYTLAAEIVRRVSGQTFAAFMKKNIFAPLKMNDTQIYDDYERIVKNSAESYEPENGVYKKKGLHLAAEGATNLLTTAEDMAKWALNLENPIVGDAELIKRFNEPSLLNNGRRVVYTVVDGVDLYHAKGQNVGTHRGVKRMSFGGHQAAFRSSFWRFPDQRVAIVFLSNDENFGQASVISQVIELYLKNSLQPLKPSVPQPPASTSKTAADSNTNLKDFEGRFYSDELEAFYTVKVIAGKLFLAHIRHGDIELTDNGKDMFTGRIEFPVQVEFSRDGSGQVVGCKLYNFGAKNMRFEKVRM